MVVKENSDQAEDFERLAKISEYSRTKIRQHAGRATSASAATTASAIRSSTR
jgi:hypothetical protein